MKFHIFYGVKVGLYRLYIAPHNRPGQGLEGAFVLYVLYGGLNYRNERLEVDIDFLHKFFSGIEEGAQEVADKHG